MAYRHLHVKACANCKRASDLGTRFGNWVGDSVNVPVKSKKKVKNIGGTQKCFFSLHSFTKYL